MTTFTKLGVGNDIVKALEDMKITTPSEIQEKAIPVALKGKDIIGGSATGSGKTLVFAAPIIENLKPGEYVQALILTPTRELAIQVSDSVKKFATYKDINITSVYGGVGIEPQIKKIADADVVVGTPGRILDHMERKSLRLDHIQFLVLDEVDRMFDMGFYKDVEHIISACNEKRQTMLFSATISNEVDHIAQNHTKSPVTVSVESYVDHTKLTQEYYDVDNNKKFSLLVHFLKNETADLVMVFCATRRNADFVQKNLRGIGIEAHAIHGGLSQHQRTKVINQFHTKGVKVLICTDVAARGLDIKGVSHVYNYDLPNTVESYIHRIGRTARAGKDGKAITLLSNRDYEKFEAIDRDEHIKLVAKKLPEFERVAFRMNSGRQGSGRQGDNRRRDGRGDRRGGRDNRGGRRGGDRRDSRGGGRRDARGGDRGGNRGPRRDNRRDSRDGRRGGDRRDSRGGPRPRRNANQGTGYAFGGRPRR